MKTKHGLLFGFAARILAVAAAILIAAGCINSTSGKGGEAVTLPGNWKSLDQAGWEAWASGAQNATLAEKMAIWETILQQSNWNQLTAGGKTFWLNDRGYSNIAFTAPSEHQKTWNHPSITSATLKIEAVQFTFTGVSRAGVYQILSVGTGSDGKFHYWFKSGSGYFIGWQCKMTGSNFEILNGSAVEDDWRVPWTSTP